MKVRLQHAQRLRRRSSKAGLSLWQKAWLLATMGKISVNSVYGARSISPAVNLAQMEYYMNARKYAKDPWNNLHPDILLKRAMAVDAAHPASGQERLSAFMREQISQRQIEKKGHSTRIFQPGEIERLQQSIRGISGYAQEPRDETSGG